MNTPSGTSCDVLIAMRNKDVELVFGYIVEENNWVANVDHLDSTKNNELHNTQGTACPTMRDAKKALSTKLYNIGELFLVTQVEQCYEEIVQKMKELKN